MAVTGNCRRWIALLAVLAPATAARAQVDVQYAEEPTGGLDLPSYGIAGEGDATQTTLNPAGLQFLSGPHMGLALTFDEDDTSTAGPGWGAFYGSRVGGGIFPAVGFGMAVEWLRPERSRLAPDPGTPARFTMGFSTGSESSALGVSWHHFFDEGLALDGVDTFDIGYASRLGAYFGWGAVVRDVNTPNVAGTPVQRRYELELVTRPAGTDRLELAVGGRVGETRADFDTGQDVDGWVRWSLRVVEGLYVRGEVVSRSLNELTVSATSVDLDVEREWQASAGIEVSLGGLGVTGLGSGVVGGGDTSASGGTALLRVSPVHPPSVLPTRKRIEKLQLTGAIGDRAFTGIVAQLRRVADDDDVAGVLVQFDGLSGGWATLHELRQELLKVRARGIKVLSFMTAGTTREYFVASASDAIYVDPAGGIRLLGMAGTVLYFKGLFDKLGVTAEFEKIEEYKSAPESWTRTGPSEPAFRMRNSLYDSLYDRAVADIADGRGITVKRARELIDGGPYTAGDLQDLPDLVDRVVDPDGLAEAMREDMGGDYPIRSAPLERAERWDYPKVAVIYIVGDIVDGKSTTVPLLGRSLVGSETIVQAIASARADRSVGAIILRIDSPGGSALASEVMAREVFKTRGQKPILCSMGDYAASGGYFVAAGCDVIYADPMTITGSIGIFNGKFDLSALLARLGLSWSTYKRGERSDLESMYKSFTPEERALMKEKLRYFYGRFLQAVALGRDMTVEEVDGVGRGRVWSGAQSKPIGLVDELGGLSEVFDVAKAKLHMAHSDKFTIVMLPQENPTLLQRVLGGGASASEPGALWRTLLPGRVDEDIAAAIPASLWHQPGAVQARLPFHLSWGDGAQTGGDDPALRVPPAP